MASDSQAPAGGLKDHADEFVAYYEQQSVSETTRQRFEAIKDGILRMRKARGLPVEGLEVADVGCGAGTQSIMWARDGHRVRGLDVSDKLLDIGRARAREAGQEIEFTCGTATELPWPDACVDVSIVPELLEHVADWESVVREGVRILKPEGTLYLSTTNKLCPVQNEFELPLYSWYPGPLKRYYERVSVTTRPELVNHAEYPAVHWFTPYQLQRVLRGYAMTAQDRFDIADLDNKGALARLVFRAIRAIAPLRYLGHVATPYSVVIAHK